MRPRPTPFILLAKSRSRSKWLVELLDSHDEIAAYGEYEELIRSDAFV